MSLEKLEKLEVSWKIRPQLILITWYINSLN